MVHPANDSTPSAELEVPILIGVTGHRTIAPSRETELGSQVRSILKGLQTNLPSSRLVLVSALAEGADQLVAEIAIELGYELLVPLPMAKERYSATFTTSKGRTRMLDLLKASTLVDNLGLPGDAPQGGYTRVGSYLEEHSHLLLALWDGQPKRGSGGTAEVIDAARTSIPVVWFHTPRSDTECGPSTTASPSLLPPHKARRPSGVSEAKVALSAGSGDWHNALTALDRWNAAIPNDPDVDSESSIWEKRFRVADGTAQRLQRSSRRLFFIRLWLVVCGFLSLELATGPMLGEGWISICALFLLSVGTVGLNRRNLSLDRSYLDLRTLAEHLRIRTFFPPGDNLSEATVSLTRHLRGIEPQENWISHALDAWQVKDGFLESPVEPASTALLLENWVREQLLLLTISTSKTGTVGLLLDRGLQGTSRFRIGSIHTIGSLISASLPRVRHQPQDDACVYRDGCHPVFRSMQSSESL